MRVDLFRSNAVAVAYKIPPGPLAAQLQSRSADKMVRRDFGEIEMSPREAIAFVKRYGVVLQAARGPVPSLAEAIAGGPIRGSWWGHAKGRMIFQAAQAVCKSPEVLVCKLIDGKVTYVHRRLWPALVKLAPRFRKEQLAKVWDEHTESGAHESRQLAFPEWVPGEVMREAEALSVGEAEQVLSALLARRPEKRGKVVPSRAVEPGVAGATAAGARRRTAVPSARKRREP